jgi:dTDP-4-dehydrorhamnose reductase
MSAVPMNILIVGGGGQVGLELQRVQWPAETNVYAPRRSELDIGDAHSIAAVMGRQAWSAVINTAAYTQVDKAQSEVGDAWRINAIGPALLAAASASAGVPLIHVSTDYVFDGEADRPYREDDRVGPLGVYGASKEGGEQAVRTANLHHVIVRTAWLVSSHRSNFLKTMLRLGAERSELAIVADQVGCPTIATDLASALSEITIQHVRDPAAPSGTYHFVNEGETSWYGFAHEIFQQAEARGLPTPAIKPILTSDYPTPARRPRNSRLSTEKLSSDFGIMPPPWQEGLGTIIDELSASAALTAAALTASTRTKRMNR